jgi:hypothetical protein
VPQVPQIALSTSISDYFEEVVADAIRSRQVDATNAASTYLVGLLCDYAHPDENAESALTRPLTFLLRDALEATGSERFRRLRALGDGVLYVLGFFWDHMEQRGIDRGYVVTVGSSAYDHAAAMLRITAVAAKSGPNVLSELSAKFDQFADVLSDVADGTLASSAHGDAGLVKLYERWLRTGSSRIAEALGAYGLVPTRGTGGVN